MRHLFFLGCKLLEKSCKVVLVFIEVSLIGLCFTLIIPSWRKNLSLISIFYEIAWNAQPELLHVGQIWYLAALFFASIFFYIMLKFCKNKSIIMITILGLIMFILSYMTTFIPIRIYILNHILRIPLKIDTAFAAVLLIVMGYVMKHYNLLTKLKELSKIFKIMIFMVSACVLAIIVKYNGHVNIANCLYNNPVMYLIGGWVGITVIVTLATFLNESILLRNILSFYGKNSLAIFSIHSLFLYLYANILSHIFNKQFNIMVNLTYSMAVIGTIFVAVMCIPIPSIFNRTIFKVNNKILNRMGLNK